MSTRVEVLLEKLNIKLLIFVFFLVIAVIAVGSKTKINIIGNHEGIFLLRGEHGALFELQDDLFLGQEGRYIAGVDLEDEKKFFWKMLNKNKTKEPYLYCEWNEKTGTGYIRNYLSDGKQVLTNFSRFEDEFEGEAKGLFVGGGLPKHIHDDNRLKKSATGMAYYDGTRWYHIWCNANELLGTSKLEPIYPHDWQYLGSKVLKKNESEIIIKSLHKVTINGVPLHIERYAFFRAGDPYFLLSVHIGNIGNNPVTYDYVYGDDPWLGDFGSSAGNVGWAVDGLYNYVGGINLRKIHYAGYFAHGNDAIKEGHNFSGLANFIEWFGVEPSFAYFSNGPFDIPPINNELIPLSSNARFFAINWGLQTLQPGQVRIYTLAIGLAGRNPKTGLPMKPEINLSNYP